MQLLSVAAQFQALVTTRRNPHASLIPAPHVAAFTSFMRATSKVKRKSTLLLFSVAVLLAGGAAGLRGQSALDGFDPNANGTVLVVVVQPDGKILLGGDFTTLSPNGGVAVTRNRIARLNPDGTLDTAFNPNANGTVQSIAVQADGKILAGGDFNGANSIGGQTRNRIARLDPTNGLADSFDPNANAAVYSIAVQADGKILAGGDFNGANSIGGQTRNRIARLDPTTGLADSFDPDANGSVISIAVQADGKILAGGNFAFIGGQTRNRIARLDPTTGLADSFDPNANGFVRSIVVQADGKILVGGNFFGANSIGGQTRNNIARLDATTGLADSFNPNANTGVISIAVQADGKILAGGNFTSIGGQTRNNIARLDATTGLADSFDPNANSTVYSIAVQADGKVLAGGVFTTLAPNGGAAVTRNSIARLETDGRLDQTLDLSTVGSFVTATAVQPDGKILIGGFFTTVLGVARNHIARLNTDGTLDTAFNPNANTSVLSIAVQADGKILAGGVFNSIGGQTRRFIARLDATTGLADSFNPNANSTVWPIAVQADGKILAGGQFTSIGGQTRNRIARLDATTGLADSFDPNANSLVFSIAVQADGKILAGGQFTSIGGQTRNRIARLDATTGLADSFNPNANDEVVSMTVQADGKILASGDFTSIGGQTRNTIARLDATTGAADLFDPNANGYVISIAVQADGKILASGGFNSIGGQTRNRIARLDATTGLADSFNPNANASVDSIAVQADGKILAGGTFTSIGGQPRSRFARLSNDTAALQDLAVTQTTITWTRGGSSPQFTRVTFEYSTDNLNYTPLGNGTAAGSNWILTGLSLPTGQNFYIRARGYYRSGYQNGSESITESVRYAFLAGPTGTPTPTPPPTPTPTPTSTPTPTLTPGVTPSPSPSPSATATPSGTPSPSPTCSPSWSAGATFPAAAVARAVGNYFSANGRFYVIGGRNADVAGADFTNPFEYNPTTNTWVTKVATYPDNEVNNMACGVLTVGGTPQIYCVGGSRAGVGSANNTARVFSYNPVTDTITTLTAADNWPGNAAGTILPGGFAVAGNKLYIIGGYNIGIGSTAQTWQFDPTAAVGSRWLQRQTYPLARSYIPAASIGGLIYTGGGSSIVANTVRTPPTPSSMTPLPIPGRRSPTYRERQARRARLS